MASSSVPIAYAADESRPATVRADFSYLAGAGALYLLVTLVIVFSVDTYWSLNWDAEAFLGAARSFYDGGSPFDLYAIGREQFGWPYLYPPLYAMLLAPVTWLSDRAWMPAWTTLIAVRLPLIVTDLGVAVTLYTIVWTTIRDRVLARLAVLAWLFTPILFYQTAIQGHHESTWLWPALGAYWWLSQRGVERAWVPALLLSLSVALKQTGIVYAIPFGLILLWRRQWRDMLISGAIFALIFGGTSLPFMLHSRDFVDLVFFAVPNQPVQTQSWLVWLLSFESFLTEQTRSTFPLIEYSSLIVIGLVSLVSLFLFARRQSGRSNAAGHWWFSLGLVVTLISILFSQKVMAYHYPMIVPWLLAAYMPARRLNLVAAALLWVSWIVVSPYYAPWAAASHLPFYAILGTLNSLVFLALLIYTLRDMPAPAPDTDDRQGAGPLLGLLVTVTLGFVLASASHPLTTLVPDPGQQRQWLVFGLLAGTIALTLALYTPVARVASRLVGVAATRLRIAHIAITLWLVPLFFTWFGMTSEITAVIEKGLWEAWGL